MLVLAIHYRVPHHEASDFGSSESLVIAVVDRQPRCPMTSHRLLLLYEITARSRYTQFVALCAQLETTGRDNKL